MFIRTTHLPSFPSSPNSITIIVDYSFSYRAISINVEFHVKQYLVQASRTCLTWTFSFYHDSHGSSSSSSLNSSVHTLISTQDHSPIFIKIPSFRFYTLKTKSTVEVTSFKKSFCAFACIHSRHPSPVNVNRIACHYIAFFLANKSASSAYSVCGTLHSSVQYLHNPAVCHTHIFQYSPQVTTPTLNKKKRKEKK